MLAPPLADGGVAVTPLPLFTTQSEAVAFANAGLGRRARILLGARRRLRRRLAATDSRWEVAFVQRQIDLLPTRSLERRALTGRASVLDVDDALWLDTRPEARGHPLAGVKRTAPKVAWLAGAAELVIAGNELLAEWLSRYAAEVEVVPSLVDTRTIPVRQHEQSDSIVLGWIGSPSTAKYLAAAVEMLRRVPNAAPELRWELVAMGGPLPRIPGITCTELPWSEPGERDLLAKMDIGLMPLPDTAWARGKCAYKALLYMAAGVPVVCDDVGVSARVVGDGVGGLVATAPVDWTEALVTLGRDAGLRARLGSAGRERVEAEFSVSVWTPRLITLIRRAAGRRISAPQHPPQQEADGASDEQHGERDSSGLRGGRVP
jgi:glycosyltransferase involved in cell wall biosynthesis